MQPYKKKIIGYGWTNNNCESANHILKAATHWKQTEIPKFIEVISSIVNNETTERCRAIRGIGNYRLTERYANHYQPIHNWSGMSQESRDFRQAHAVWCKCAVHGVIHRRFLLRHHCMCTCLLFVELVGRDLPDMPCGLALPPVFSSSLFARHHQDCESLSPRCLG